MNRHQLTPDKELEIADTAIDALIELEEINMYTPEVEKLVYKLRSKRTIMEERYERSFKHNQ